MPRQTSTPPRWLTRWNYWAYFIAYPMPAPPVELPPTTDTFAIPYEMRAIYLRDFSAILTGTESSEMLVTWEVLAQCLLHLKEPALAAEPDRRVRALCYIIYFDRLWSQERWAQAVFQTLSPPQQEALKAFDRKKWPSQSLQTWGTLLQTIAKDQEIFQAYVTHNLLPWKGYRLSGGDAHRLYNAYHQQMSILLGRGFLLPKAWHDKPYPPEVPLTKGRMPTNQLLATEEEVFHWFAHALRNLNEYRYGRSPRPWPHDPASCADVCRTIQQRLLPPRHHS